MGVHLKFYIFVFFLALTTFFSSNLFAQEEARFVQVAAFNPAQRTQIASLGVSIEGIRSDCVWVIAKTRHIERLKARGFKILSNLPLESITHSRAFPSNDTKYHDYYQTLLFLQGLQKKFADVAAVVKIGESVEKRTLWGLHINTDPRALHRGLSGKPGIVFVGNHHAREHLTNEMCLLLAQHLLEHRSDPVISALLQSRDIWIIPMLNPDGVEFDISNNQYHYWRKNRRENSFSINIPASYGTDLNRNYDFKFGETGASSDPDDETYHGPNPFSEPETAAFSKFIHAQQNIKIILSLHTFGEMVLYPWGYQYDPIANSKDRAVFEKLAKTMASWNRYKPMQASSLYRVSGEMMDWAYGTHGIFAFTFELSPQSSIGGGFYPGNEMIAKAFQNNLRPFLYLIEMTGDPYQVLERHSSGFLKHYIEPRIELDKFW